ncbi:cytoskeleton-associated protein [Ordospora pajunii]|uniref:cytoskeleton-associated protein n=1 Tax=Ordospora pajunii TaxID=3039483 RepID=UPI00295270B1|nr:cytoskeleton-associated protein [Ordospora pajunii]KAH9411288.1 cytoskeleton-associated protein [Ordospora pajunii]
MVLLMLNDRLTLGDRFKGTVRYLGGIRTKEGKWVGLELDEPVGANDGSVNGVRYFDCKDKHGIFVRYERIKEGLVCEDRGKAIDGSEMPTVKIGEYESKISELEKTIEQLRNAERQELAELRKELICLEEQKLQKNADYSIEERRDANEKGLRASRWMGKTNTNCVTDQDERRRVVHLVSRIIHGVLDEEMEAVECLYKEFECIMKKNGIVMD